MIAPDEAESELERLVRAGAPDAERQRAAERLERSRYCDSPRHLGRLVAECGDGPDGTRLVLATGGGPGLMEAANRGACEAGAALVAEGMIDERDAALFSIAESATEVWSQIRDWYTVRGRALIE